MTELKDANTNPWYVLMTLYGEQDEQNANLDVHADNVGVWNAWSLQGLESDEMLLLKQCLPSKQLVVTSNWPTIESDVRQKHREVMEARFRRGYDKKGGSTFSYPGFPEFNDDVDLSGIVFDGPLIMQLAVFSQSVSFHGSVFKNALQFGHVTFWEKANFSNVTFEGRSSLNNSYFKDKAYFGNSKFEETFEASGSEFQNSAFFQNSSFSKIVNFEGVEFKSDVNFGDVEFGFEGSQSACLPYFRKSKFGGTVDFRTASFYDHYPVFGGATLSNNMMFSAEPENWKCVERRFPLVADLQMKHSPTVTVAKENCAIIRNAMAQQGMPEGEHFFFRREMEFAGQLATGFAQLPYCIFGVLSDYGHSIARPVIGLGVLWIVPALIYTFAFQWMLIMDSRREITLDGFGLSFANIFKFFGFQRTYYSIVEIQGLHGWLQFMGAAQTVIGFVLLFFLGLGLRTRFRMR